MCREKLEKGKPKGFSGALSVAAVACYVVYKLALSHKIRCHRCFLIYEGFWPSWSDIWIPRRKRNWTVNIIPSLSPSLRLSLSLCLSFTFIKNVYVLLVKIVTVHVHLGFWQVHEINSKIFNLIFLSVNGFKRRWEEGKKMKQYDNSN